MSSLPEEIYLEILLRVPVKSTFVCRCVCKKWYALISDPDFVRFHLDITTQRNNCSLLVQNKIGYRLYSSFDSDDGVFVELETPYKYLTNRRTTLLGSCNGLVYGWNGQLKFFFLWNPATKEYKRLPKFDGDDSLFSRYHGFGYDYKTGDYKLVNIHQDKKSSFVQVYSIKSNSWKSSQSIQYGFPSYDLHSGVLVNGTLHWFIIGNTESLNGKVIASMDISEERFQELQLPVILPDQYCTSVGVIEECLCVLAHSHERKTIEVWVMKVYGVPASWTKLCTIMYDSIMRGSGLNATLIGSFKNGEILFRNGCNIVSYDPVYETATKTEIDDLDWGGAVKYFESLVSVKSVNKKSMTKKRNRSLRKHKGG